MTTPSSAMICDPFVPLRYRVLRAVREDAETVTLDLAAEGDSVPAYKPGQFNMLYALGIGEAAISISGDATDQSRYVHTIRAVGATSTALTQLKAGESVGLRGPFGSAWPIEAARGKDVVIVAGGLGLAPLRPTIYHLFHAREKFGRVAILIGMRNPAGILYRHEIEHWRSHLDVDVEVTVDHADQSWHGHVGVVPALVPKMSFDPANTVAMVCGPEIMMRFTAHALRDAGVPETGIYLSMERNMKCAIGLCGHCQFGPHFICKDGPILRLDRMASIFALREI